MQQKYSSCPTKDIHFILAYWCSVTTFSAIIGNALNLSLVINYYIPQQWNYTINIPIYFYLGDNQFVAPECNPKRTVKLSKITVGKIKEFELTKFPKLKHHPSPSTLFKV